MKYFAQLCVGISGEEKNVHVQDAVDVERSFVVLGIERIDDGFGVELLCLRDGWM